MDGRRWKFSMPFQWISALEYVGVPGMADGQSHFSACHSVVQVQSDGSQLPRISDCSWGNTKINLHSLQVPIIMHPLQLFICICFHHVTGSGSFNALIAQGLTCERVWKCLKARNSSWPKPNGSVLPSLNLIYVYIRLQNPSIPSLPPT